MGLQLHAMSHCIHKLAEASSTATDPKLAKKLCAGGEWNEAVNEAANRVQAQTHFHGCLYPQILPILICIDTTWGASSY
ncbi:hypothetical protein PIB30_090546 [Stylosanthes scabra]|uniref:Uncharacterized protein n=1 Tax=Stylosanthes scabra TaxID=79078 RepID=A0ABU6YTV2_9FABA|nr:hypothetical protein [Stylosanthes scabra]